MKIFTLSALSGLTLTLLLSACSKHHDVGPIVDPPTTGAISINLTTGPIAAGVEEVIISESGGKILLDSTGPFNNSLVATLHTNQKLLDYTVIDHDSITSMYYADTYKSVDLSNWTDLYQGDYSAPIPQVATKPASIVYSNIPYNPGAAYLNNYIGGGGFLPFSGPPNTLAYNYTQFTNNYVYLLFPGTWLYNFHLPQGLSDTVDISHMDTAASFNFKMPAGNTVSNSLLFGFMDTTDFGRSVILFGNGFYSGLGKDMVYPRKVVQKYETFVNADNVNGKNIFAYYTYGDSVPATLPIPDLSAAYTISSSQNTNFSVKFGSASPSYYFTLWNSSGVRLTLYSSPDSTTTNPVGLLTSFKSKMLKGQDLSGMALSIFEYESTQGFKYQDFMSYIHNSDMIKKHRVPVSIKFGQTF